MSKILSYILLCILLFVGFESFSQKDSTITVIDSTNISILDDISFVGGTTKNPNRAALFSAIIPGLGQAYNEKYWKIPIVYATLGGGIYWYDYNNRLYHRYHRAYIAEADTLESTISEFAGQISEANLQHNTDAFLRNRSLSIILIAVIYGFNIIDATVDAHLFDFDVSEDLSFKIYPAIIPEYSAYGTKNVGIGIEIRF